MILSPVEKLRRFLKLEISRNCDNKAVMGGLDRFLPNWQKESAAAGVDPELIGKVSDYLATYVEKDIEARKAATLEILKCLPQPEAGNAAEAPRRGHRTAEREPRKGESEHRQQAAPSENTASPRRKERPARPKAAAEFAASAPKPVPGNEEKPAEMLPVEGTETVAAPSAEEKPASAAETAPVFIRHEPRSKTAAISVRSLRERYGRSSINPNGPSVDGPVSQIPGIGMQNAKALAKQGVYTIRDFLYYFPRRYDDYSQFRTIARLRPDEVVTVIGIVRSVSTGQRGRYQVTECLVSDTTGTLRVTWFNRAWLTHQLHEGMGIILSGKIDIFLGRPVMSNPEWEPADQDNIVTNRIVPNYALNQNLKQNFLRRMMFNTVRHWTSQLPEFLPDSVLESADLLPLQQAIQNIHFPESHALLQYARERLAFDEVFLMQLAVLGQKQDWNELTAEVISVSDEQLMQGWIEKLPFKLTNAQLTAIADIRKDMASGHPMNRLVQGDVGSGKTVVASIAALMAVQDEGQAAIMAPTGVLAEQHYRNFLRFMEGIGEENLPLQPEQVALITGATPDAQKQTIRERLENGEIRVIIGTHALIEAPIQFKKLRLAVIDEQHRFGVDQRAALRAKGSNPHLLVMTATPIPRSLSLTIYGDLDLTLIDELPAGRQPVTTYIVPQIGRESAYKLIGREINAGHQAFIIYPLVEEGENEENEGRAAIEGSEYLQQQIFPEYKVALLHGRMKGSEKDAILEAFKNHEYDILVSTSVIEVGVDVPNATVMMIEGANRFGLAQLHQFRGRVGRGSEKACCLLLSDKENDTDNQRLKAMVDTADGFKLAEMDLEMRGPGDFIGKRQSGMRDMKMASMLDVRLIEKARNEAARLFAADPHLEKEENTALKARVAESAASQQKGEIS